MVYSGHFTQRPLSFDEKAFSFFLFKALLQKNILGYTNI